MVKILSYRFLKGFLVSMKAQDAAVNLNESCRSYQLGLKREVKSMTLIDGKKEKKNPYLQIALAYGFRVQISLY